MVDLLSAFPAHIADAVRIARATPLSLRASGIRNIVLTGLGGSAIGGDLLKSYLANELTIPFIVNRQYVLPEFVDRHSLVIVSSYSGNTEETISAHRDALRRNARVLCISSNGETARLAERKKGDLIRIPGGMPPRTALAYSFFPLLLALHRIGLVRNKMKEIHETAALLKESTVRYATPEHADNTALRIAALLVHKLPIVYSSTERFDAVATRWRGQIAENAKALSFGHVLPEMNHNELVGWKVLVDQMRSMHVLFLRDRRDHPQIQKRMEITRGIVTQHAGGVTEVWSEGTSLLARMFSLVSLGDWVSYYLALLHGEDPTPVAVIDQLKKALAGT
jgi:glucose/mannose-6-phosphate isomerase